MAPIKGKWVARYLFRLRWESSDGPQQDMNAVGKYLASPAARDRPLSEDLRSPSTGAHLRKSGRAELDPRAGFSSFRGAVERPAMRVDDATGDHQAEPDAAAPLVEEFA